MAAIFHELFGRRCQNSSSPERPQRAIVRTPLLSVESGRAGGAILSVESGRAGGALLSAESEQAGGAILSAESELAGGGSAGVRTVSKMASQRSTEFLSLSKHGREPVQANFPLKESKKSSFKEIVWIVQ